MLSRARTALAFAVSLAAAPAFAASPAALVTSLAGTSQPNLKPFSEVAAGATIDLGASSRMTFVHYRTCHAITAVGGTLHIGAAEYSDAGGRIESDVAQACPRQLTLAAPGTAVTGGLTLRSVATGAPLPLGASILFVGYHADDVRTIQFLDGDRLVTEATVVDRHLAWPDSKPMLEPGSDYRMVLRGDNGLVIEKKVRPTGDAQKELFLVRVD